MYVSIIEKSLLDLIIRRNFFPTSRVRIFQNSLLVSKNPRGARKPEWPNWQSEGTGMCVKKFVLGFNHPNK